MIINSIWDHKSFITNFIKNFIKTRANKIFGERWSTWKQDCFLFSRNWKAVAVANVLMEQTHF